MYQDILRVIDPENNSMNELNEEQDENATTNSAQSSTSLSSFNNSTGELPRTKSSGGGRKSNRATSRADSNSDIK